jgi:hypothetical protein
LDSETQDRFTREEWFLKNQWFADDGSVVYHIESVERLGTSGGTVVEVSLRLTYEDGSSATRITHFMLSPEPLPVWRTSRSSDRRRPERERAVEDTLSNASPLLLVERFCIEVGPLTMLNAATSGRRHESSTIDL